jgi:hypothetical protein
MTNKIAWALMFFGMTGVASAAGPIVTDICKDVKALDRTKHCKAALAPEIDPSSAIAGLTLLLGSAAVIRGRRVTPSKDR